MATKQRHQHNYKVLKNEGEEHLTTNSGRNITHTVVVKLGTKTTWFFTAFCQTEVNIHINESEIRVSSDTSILVFSICIASCPYIYLVRVYTLPKIAQTHFVKSMWKYSEKSYYCSFLVNRFIKSVNINEDKTTWLPFYVLFTERFSPVFVPKTDICIWVKTQKKCCPI